MAKSVSIVLKKDFYRTPLNTFEDLLVCDQEIATVGPEQATCELYQTRTYELLNQDADEIVASRILKVFDGAQIRDFQVFSKR